MKTAYFDCSSGIAGNMLLGALIDAGLPVEHLKNELRTLRITQYTLHITLLKTPTKAIKLEVKLKGRAHPRNLNDILKIINRSGLSKNVKTISSRIFKTLAEAEAKVHGIPINKVHFHEVGAVDAIIDIVGAAIGLDYFGIEEVCCSPINVGSGRVKFSHGTFPIPAPATAELLKSIPIYSSGIKRELTTPTGAAIIKTLASSFDPLPRLKVEAVGSGAGGYPLKVQPDFLRILIGEKELETEKDAILVLETNLDDTDPKLYDEIIARLMKAGALDAFIEPIRMKKMRSAVKLTVLCSVGLKDKLLKVLFKETTSFGARVYLVEREKLSRTFKKVKTKYGKVRLKIGRLGKKVMTVAPEYEDYARLAKKHHVPVNTVYQEVFKQSELSFQ